MFQAFCTAEIGGVQYLPRMELAISNAEEFQLCNGGVNAVFDQLSFLAEGLAPQFVKFNAIANRTYRAGQIMA